MFKHILQSAEGINWFAIIPMILFFAIFLGSIIMVLTGKKKYFDKMSQLPLEDEFSQNSETE